MRKIKVCPNLLELGGAELPYGDGLRVIKLFPEQAALYRSDKEVTFDDLIKRYGQNRCLQAGEFYNGYAVVHYHFAHSELVRMRGILRPTSAKGWECVMPLEKGQETRGFFDKMLTIADCRFAELIKLGQDQQDDTLFCINGQKVDARLKEKLAKAFISEEHMIDVDEIEDYVLRQYFGEYYDRFFRIRVSI